MANDLNGQVAVILGGTGVLGKALTRGLAAAGARIALVGRTPEKLNELASEVGGLPVVCDASDRDSLAEACKEIEEKLGPPQILLSLIGGNDPAATAMPDRCFFDLDAEALRKVVDLNLFSGAILPTLAFGKALVHSGKPASIILVTSVSAELPLTRVGGYGAAKAGVSNFTKWTAVELGRRSKGRVRVNAIEPGFFLTEQNRFLLTDKETGQPTERGKSVLDHTPSGRFGDPEDLVGAALWLASDASRFVNGAIIPVDGGFTAWWGV